MSGDLPDDLYFSPVLAQLDSVPADAENRTETPDHTVACADCPSGIWYWEGADDLHCYCSAMHRPTWPHAKAGILQCDGREQALARIAELKTGQRS